MKAAVEKTTGAPAGRSAAQLAGAHHGRSAAAMAAATAPDEEYPVQRAGGTAQMKFQALARPAARPGSGPLVSAHSRQVAQLQAVVRRRAGEP